MWLIWLNWHYEHIRDLLDQIEVHFHIVVLLILNSLRDFKQARYLYLVATVPARGFMILSACQSSWELEKILRRLLTSENVVTEIGVCEPMASLYRYGICYEIDPVVMSYLNVLPRGWRFLLLLVEYHPRGKENGSNRTKHSGRAFLFYLIIQGPSMTLLLSFLKHGSPMDGQSSVLELPCCCLQEGKKKKKFVRT